eukprot:474203-Hanusia_phi.AAC.3
MAQLRQVIDDREMYLVSKVVPACPVTSGLCDPCDQVKEVEHDKLTTIERQVEPFDIVLVWW